MLSIVRPYDGVGLDVFRNEVVSVSDSILTGYDIHYGGTAYVTGSVPKLIRDDVGTLIKMGMIIMLIILLINLRSLKAVLLVVMVIVFSLIAMMGFMGWVYRLTGSDKFLFALFLATNFSFRVFPYFAYIFAINYLLFRVCMEKPAVLRVQLPIFSRCLRSWIVN